MDTKAWTASNLAARLLAGPRTLDGITAAIDAVLGPIRARTRAKLATAILALAEDTHPPSPRSLASLLLASPDFHPPSLGRHAAAYGETPCYAPSYAGSKGGPRMTAPNFDDQTRTELEAAAFRRLVEHLRERTDVQNIDMMNLAGFCRNCLSRWYREGAAEQGITLADPDAREIVYGMPYKEWQAKYQKEASGDQKAAFAKANPGH